MKKHSPARSQKWLAMKESRTNGTIDAIDRTANDTIDMCTDEDIIACEVIQKFNNGVTLSTKVGPTFEYAFNELAVFNNATIQFGYITNKQNHYTIEDGIRAGKRSGQIPMDYNASNQLNIREILNMNPSRKEYICYAAVAPRDLTGKYIVGFTHAAAYDKLGTACLDAEYGFVTNTERFVSREEAYEIAVNAGQIREKDEHRLYSYEIDLVYWSGNSDRCNTY